MKPATKRTMRWLALLTPLALGACATRDDSMPSLASAYGADAQQLLVTRESEDRLTVSGLGEVSIGRSYTSASGRICRKLNKLDGTPLPLRSCQDKKGQWYTTRSISASEPFNRYSSEAVDGTSVEMVTLTLKQDESLWSFASRVTGNALNWKRIANDNDIADGNKVQPGQALQVEVSLLKDEK